jgi:uncharacterized repeat protein (TIGR03803 family)
MDSSGNLYGTTYLGGALGLGTVFKLATGTHKITTLVAFNGSDGNNPRGVLIFDRSGNLYGTTTGGGTSSDGTVFELPKGRGTITTLASFNGSDGSDPQAGVIMDSSGNLFGTTNNGGSALNLGTVFELTGAAAPMQEAMEAGFLVSAPPPAAPIVLPPAMSGPRLDVKSVLVAGQDTGGKKAASIGVEPLKPHAGGHEIDPTVADIDQLFATEWSERQVVSGK